MECQFCNLELGKHTVHGQGICGKHAEKLIRRIEALEKLVAAQPTLVPDGGTALLNYDPLPDIERISKQGYVSPATGKA